MGLRSLGLADLGAGLCKRNSVLNILCPSSLIIYSTYVKLYCRNEGLFLLYRGSYAVIMFYAMMTTMNVISRIPVTWPAEESPKRLTMTNFQKHSRWSVHLRDRPHSRQLPDCMSHLTNCNLIVRMLFFATVIDCIHSLSSCRPILSVHVCLHYCGLTVLFY